MSDASFEDRFLIRELYGRYALAAGDKDLDAWLGCWAQDAAWKTPHFELSGQPALREQWGMIWAGFEKVAAFNEVGAIRVAGDSAEAIAATYEIVALKGGGTLKMAGIYRDRIVREDGRWRFAARSYELVDEQVTAPA